MKDGSTHRACMTTWGRGTVPRSVVPHHVATQLPEEKSARLAVMPPQLIRIMHEGRLTAPFVYAVVGERNPVTLGMEWVEDRDTRIPVGLFTRGHSYEVLGLFRTDRHLIGASGAESRIHLLGTDRLGRDQWSRLMYGTRTSMSIGLVAVALSIVLGVVLGGISGYFGGVIDVIIQRLIELLQSLPAIPVWLALSAAVPRTWSVEQVYFAITIILALRSEEHTSELQSRGHLVCRLL